MLAQLSTVKSRLAITVTDFDAFLTNTWPSGGNYQQFFFLDLLPSVSAVLKSHQRLAL